MLLGVVVWLDEVLSAFLAGAGRVGERAATLVARLSVLPPLSNSVHNGLGRLNSYAGVATPIAFKGAGCWSYRILTARTPIHPALRNFVTDLHATLLRVFAYGCALAAVGLLVFELFTASADCLGFVADRWSRTGSLFATGSHGACGPGDVDLAAAPMRGEWIEAARAPKLRGRQ